MGSPTTTTNITSNVFENNNLLSYSNGGQSNSADVRTTNASTGYSGASSGGNIFFSSTSGAYGFSIEGINASSYTTLSLQFGYRKESSTSHALFSVDYWNGNTWEVLANSETDLFNESASASAKWYLSKVLTLPIEARINGLKIRFVKTGNKAIRIDDVLLTATTTPIDTPSSSSDIVFNSSSSTSNNANINYLNYQAETITSTANSVGVMGFYLRDGGVGHHDIDTYPTELTSISFAITNSANIRSARLFVGNSPRGTSISVNGASIVSFTNLTNIIAADDEQLAVNLRVTFNSTVTDNEQMQFTVSAVTASSLGSQFAAGNGGGASSSVAGDINRIEVMASKLEFTQQPPSVFYTDFIMHPAPTISALDENGNLDLDYSENVTMTSSGILTNPQTVASINGVATFLNIVHSTPGLGVFLTVNSNGLNSSLSSSFIIETSAIYHLINNLPGEIQTSYFQNTTCQNNSCNLIINGDFEEFNILPNNISQIQNACGWNGYFTPDYYHSQSPNPNVSIPCNIKGGETVNNNQGNGYAGLFINNMGSEIMVSKLASPLVQGIKYKLSFDVSLAEGNSSFSKSPQAYMSQSLLVPNPFLPITNPQMVFSNNTTSTLANGWETLTFDFTATGGEEYIYFGNFQNMVSLPNPIATNPDCTYNNSSNYIFPNEQPSYYYLDNIRLIAIDDFNLPDTICNINSIPNLFSFLSNAPTDGVFSGAGVIENSGIFSFDATIAGVGIHTISYTYSNSGCSPITITDDIIVVSDGIIAEFVDLNNLVLCENSTPPVLPTTSENGIIGSWNPSIVSTTSSGDYVFTPDAGQCSNSQITITTIINNTIIASNDDFSSTIIEAPDGGTTPSVFINDSVNGNTATDVNVSAIILSTTPVMDPIPTIGANGVITIPEGVTYGTYTIDYKLIDNTCINNFDIASVTIVVLPKITNCAKVYLTNLCYNSTQSQTTPLTIFNNENNGSANNTCDYAMIGTFPCNSTNVTIELITPLLYGCTINTNGTINIPIGTMPFYAEAYYQLRSIEYPTVVSDTFRVSYGINERVYPISPIIYLHAGSDPFEVYSNGSVNILNNYNILVSQINANTNGNCNLIDAIIGQTNQSNTVRITETTTPENPYYRINPQSGEIVFRAPYSSNNPPPVPVLPLQSYILTYEMCINNTGATTFCKDASVVINYYYGSNREMETTIKEKDIIVYPNPSVDGMFTLLFDQKIKVGTVEVYNLLGQKVKHDKLEDTKEYVLNLNEAANGTYLMKINNGSSEEIKRIIINRK